MIAEKDLGSSLLFFTLFVVMLWVATERATYLSSALLLFAGGAVLRLDSQFGHVQDRVDIWLDPWADPQDDGFQIVQALFALADGRRRPAPGLGLGSPDRIPRRRDRLHLRRHRRGARPARRHRRAHRLPADHRRRPAHRAARRARRSRSCSPPASPTILGVQAFIIIGGSSALAARSPASRCRSSPTAARRCRQLRAPRAAAAHLRRHRRERAGSDGGRSDEPPDPPARHRPDRLLRRPVRAAQPAPGLPGRRAQRQPEQHPRASCATSASPAGRSSPPTAWCIAAVGRRRTTGSSYQREYPDGRPVRPRHRLLHLHARQRRAWRRPTTTSWPAAPPSSQLQDLGDLFVDEDRVGDLTLTRPRPTSSSIAKRAARRAGGLGRRPRPPHRRDPRHVVVPRPTTRTCWPTTTSSRRRRAQRAARRRPRASRCWPAPTRSASSPARRSRSSPATAGVDSGGVTADEPVVPGRDAATRRRGPPGPIRNFGGATCGGTLFEILPGVVQHRLRPDGRRHSAPRRWSTAPRPSASTSDAADRPARARLASNFPTDFERNLPAAGPVGDRPERRGRPRRCRWRWWPARVANDGVIMAPHVLARRRATSDGNVVDTYDPEVWTTADGPERRPTLMREAMVGVVDGGTATRLARPRLRRRRQDRHRPARHRPAPLARLDHRLRRPAGRRAHASRSP